MLLVYLLVWFKSVHTCREGRYSIYHLLKPCAQVLLGGRDHSTLHRVPSLESNQNCILKYCFYSPCLSTAEQALGSFHVASFPVYSLSKPDFFQPVQVITAILPGSASTPVGVIVSIHLLCVLGTYVSCPPPFNFAWMSLLLN